MKNKLFFDVEPLGEKFVKVVGIGFQNMSRVTSESIVRLNICIICADGKRKLMFKNSFAFVVAKPYFAHQRLEKLVFSCIRKLALLYFVELYT